MADHPGRAGQYQAQPTGYRAFLPAPLPPTGPPIHLTGKLQPLLSQADRALGRLDGSVVTLPNPDLFVFMYVRSEAVLSSQIEGTQSSLHDLLAAEANLLSGPLDVEEVISYVKAMNYGIRRLDDLPVSVRLMNEIHEKLMEGVRGGQGHLTPGRIRTSQNWVGPAGSNLKNALFIPPPPEALRDALSNLERFLHGNDDLPLLIKIGLAHAQFETIHPYLDGNGRMGRLLITFLLTQQGILSKPVLYLSHYFKKRRFDYYEHLQATRGQGDWERWLAFFLQGVIEVSAEATETARRILTLREEHRAAIAAHLGRRAGNGHTVLEALFRQPFVTVAQVQGIIGTTTPPANSLVARLVALGILHETTGHSRNRIFRYKPYIDLFPSA